MATQEQLELRRKWIEALRSGEYRQGQKLLRDSQCDGYCCLGVLCAITGQGTWERGGFVLDGHRHDTHPPEAIIRMIGLRNTSGSIQQPDGIIYGDSLVNRNDSGSSFAQIADFIEQHPERVFID